MRNRKPGRPTPPSAPDPVLSVHARLFSSDIEKIKKIAEEKGLRWQIELRLTVRRALRGDQREVIVLKDQE